MQASSLSRRRRSRTVKVPFTSDTRPRLASSVTFEQTSEAGTWIAMLHGAPASRVSRAVVDLLRAMDGESSLRDLHRRFAPTESHDEFMTLVKRFRACGLLAGIDKLPPGRVFYRPPFTVQVATLRAPRLFGRLDRMILPLQLRATVTSIAVIVCLGLVAAGAQTNELRAAVSRPLPVAGLVSLVVALSLMTLLHESAHGLTLTRFGGRPRRAGFMLFYLTPAFFVDVTDGWRLDRRRRVAVALAGPATHAVFFAIALIVALVLSDTEVRRSVLAFAVCCGAIVLVNLIPFVRFDGYIALMSALDEPNLRGRTISDASAFLLRLLFGGTEKRKELAAWWSVPFGIASLLTPIVLMVFAVTRIIRAVGGGGPALGILVVVVEAAVVIVGFVIVMKALRRARRSGGSRFRFISVVFTLAAGIAMLGAVITVPSTATLGYVLRGDRVLLVQAGVTPTVRVPEGATVDLLSNGILVNDHLASGSVGSLLSRSTRVTLDSLLPVSADGVSVAGVIVAAVDVDDRGRRLPPTGQARVELGATNLWESLWTRGVTAPLSSLGGGGEGKE